MNRFRLASAVLLVALLAAACGQGNVFDLQVGTCFDPPDADEFSDVPIVDCAEPHENEVMALVRLTTPTLASVDVMFDGCLSRFDAAIGTPYESSAYYLDIITPTQDSWDQGDREVICYVYLLDEMSRGSALNSGR